MDVDLLPEGLADHRRAFDVPTGPALAPGAVPGRLAGLGSLPECEVARVALAGFELLAHPDELALRRPPGQLAVVRQLVDLEVDVAFGRVGVAPLDQRLDE